MGARRRRVDADDEAQAQADRREVRRRDRGAVLGLSEPPASTNAALELGRQGFELFNAGDMDRFFALLHPDITLATDPKWPGGGEYRGRDELQRFMSQFLEAFEGIRFEEVQAPETIGNLALLRGHWVGLGAASGIEATSLPFSVVFGTRDGLVSQAHFFFDDDEAQEFARSRT